MAHVNHSEISCRYNNKHASPNFNAQSKLLVDFMTSHGTESSTSYGFGLDRRDFYQLEEGVTTNTSFPLYNKLGELSENLEEFSSFEFGKDKTVLEREDATPPYDHTNTKINFRESHKLAERQRRRQMKELFDALRQVLPRHPMSKSSKWEILVQAINHITSLNSKLQSVEDELRLLRIRLDN